MTTTTTTTTTTTKRYLRSTVVFATTVLLAVGSCVTPIHGRGRDGEGESITALLEQRKADAKKRLQDFIQHELGYGVLNQTEIQQAVWEDVQSQGHVHSQTIQRILSIHNNPDCLEREFNFDFDAHADADADADVSASPSGTTVELLQHQAAIQALRNCRLLVVRNAFDDQTIHEDLPTFSQFVDDIQTGTILEEGTTTFGGNFFILKEDADRFNYMLPRELVASSGANIFANQHLMELLAHPSILGADVILNHAGVIQALPLDNHYQHRPHRYPRRPQYWHMDGSYVYDDDVGNVGLHSTPTGHDLPPFAINMFTPINLDLKHHHGPTDFCLGTSLLRGLDLDALEESVNANADSAQITQEQKDIVQSLIDFEWEKGGQQRCPNGFARTPLLNRGDVILFDYMVTHRGGVNLSDDLSRQLLFGMYSRPWYRDTTFDGESDSMRTLLHPDYDCEDYKNDADADDDASALYNAKCELQSLTHLTRFAVVERAAEAKEKLAQKHAEL